MGLLFKDPVSDIYALAAISATLLTFYLHHVFTYWQRRGFKFIPPSIPFGNFGPMIMQSQSVAELTQNIYNLTGGGERLIGIYAALRPTLLLRDPDLIRIILVKDFQYFQGRGLYIDEQHDPLSGNLFQLTGEKWKNIRTKLTPTFTSGKLKAMFSTILESCGPLQQYLDAAAQDRSIIDMRELIAQYTTNVIASVAFGIDIDCIADPNTPFRKYGRKVFENSIKNGFRYGGGLIFPKLLRFLRIKLVDQDVEDFMVDVVKNNMEYREENNVYRKDFFQLLVQLRNEGEVQDDDEWRTVSRKDKKFTFSEVAAQAFVFYAAGFETTSTTAAFCLYELARNSECQRRVQLEIETVLDKYDGKVTFESIQEMRYLDNCIDETLRMYPAAPVIFRECVKEYKIPGSDDIVKAGDMVMVPVYALHNDPKYFAEPRQFQPDRFNGISKTFTDTPYLPFGEGPRNCIGMRFAKINLKVCLAMLLKNYCFHLAGNTLRPIKLVAGTQLISPVGGLHLRIMSRECK